ncbi:radical SAM family heme chaperone HemW [Candidatus Sumerlaeota bacterium]|nr:radical SAM family heme chaperone HemW [Candidatus Sumerlaeota bacterium]
MTDLGLYIHVPFCKHACPYCDFYKLELRAIPAATRLAFTSVVEQELILHLTAHPDLAERRLETIYLGGGTPSTLKPELVGGLVSFLQRAFQGDGAQEITLEANPENLTPQRCVKWREAGINRLSIGVQTFADRHLERLERLHRAEVIDDAVANARAAGFDNISLDLMFALPNQTMEEWMESLRRAAALNPEHLSFYGLTYHENTPFHEQLEEGGLREVEEDLQAEMYLAGCGFLRHAGFEHYEISNFARRGNRSRHNQRYWYRGDVLGLGPGAHSNLGPRRWSDPEDLESWQEAVGNGMLLMMEEEPLGPEQLDGEKLFTGLRRIEGISRRESPILHNAARAWFEENRDDVGDYAACDEESFRLMETGWLVSEAIIRDIMKHLPPG